MESILGPRSPKRPSRDDRAGPGRRLDRLPLTLRIVSGGQTGADRAAFDAALELGISIGGWVRRGRRDEDGTIPARYPDLREADSPEPAVRTEWNVRDSDATLVLLRRGPTGGTRATIRLARRRGRRCRIVVLGSSARPGPMAGWLRAARLRVLNVAGPRESEAPGVYRAAFAFLRSILEVAPDRRRFGWPR